jgi:hypothetical protein
MEMLEKDRDVFDGDKYLYPIRGNACLALCKVQGLGMRIGSSACQKCEFIRETHAEEKWIICSRIEDALGEFSLPVIKRKRQLSQGIK